MRDKKGTSMKATVFLLIILSFLSCARFSSDNDQFALAKSRQDDLQLSVYITAHSVQNYLADEQGRREALSLLRCNGLTKAYIEVYRSGLTLDNDILIKTRDFFLKNGIQVVGGIATVPGGDFGVRQMGALGWFNWQNPKTQQDLKTVIMRTAPLFDEFIVDDFLCTADTSHESQTAKAGNSWSQYRRDLLVRLSNKVFIEPAKSTNPDIKMIIKFPQWYDRFHLFGYDPQRQSKIFDAIWIGTETRGQYTQRYGFVQPYEGFINYRWLASIAGEKTGGAWFDHGDCDGLDFIEQAFQTVLAGAGEIVIFHYGAFVNGHPGHHLLRRNFELLADLATLVRENPVKGVIAYKPPNSDAGGDLYLMDFIGMLGVPLIPESNFPASAKTVFLPTQAASDKNIVSKTFAALEENRTIIVTSGFLLHAEGSEELATLAGVELQKTSPLQADAVFVKSGLHGLSIPLDIETEMSPINANVLLWANASNKKVPFLTKSLEQKLYVINSHTFSKKDFDAVGEVLLCPKPLGLLDLPREWVDEIRDAFTSEMPYHLQAPSRVVAQQFGDYFMLHNYRKTPATIQLAMNAAGLLNVYSDEVIKPVSAGHFELVMPPRSRNLLKITE